MSLFHGGRIIGTYNGVRVLDCEICGFAHKESLHSHLDYYRTEFFERKKEFLVGDRFDQQHVSRWLSIEHLLLRFTPRSVLDIGCGVGDALKYYHSKAAVVVGTDVSLQSISIARQRGLRVIESSVETLRYDQRVELVRLAWVLEHVIDPKLVLERAKEWLTPTGQLLVVVPNDFSLVQADVRERTGLPMWWINPVHNNYFSPLTMIHLAKQSGYNLVRMCSTFPMEFFLLSGIDYVRNPRRGDEAHKHRVSLERNLEACVGILGVCDLYQMAAKLGIGRDVYYLFEPSF